MGTEGVRSRLSARVLLGLVGLMIVSPVPAAEDLLGLQEQSKIRLRSVRVRFEPHRDAPPGICSTLTLDHLDVSLRGDRLPRESLVELARDRRPTVHALLIDASRSMIGKLDYARKAAVEYIERLRPDIELSMVATFDESVILVRGASHDHDGLSREVMTIRMGLTTSMYDGLYYTIRELQGFRERPVIVLLTDGVDSGSLYEQDDVQSIFGDRDDVTVFTIGYELPEMASSGPSGQIATRKFLQSVARRSNGKFFDVPTGSRLGGVFTKIREMLDSEAVLTVLDPDPEDDRGRIRVRTNSEHCSVKVFRRPSVDDEADSAGVRATAPPAVAADATLPFSPADRIHEWYEEERHRGIDPACGEEGQEAPWFASLGPEGISACGLDITMETGLLYALTNVDRVHDNTWIRLKVRPIEIPVRKIDELSTRPEEVLDRLARYAIDDAIAEPETDARQRPAKKHARPFHDFPGLMHGRTFLDSRTAIARAIYTYPEYREWVHRRLEGLAELEITRIGQRFKRYAPDRTEDEIRQAVLLSEEGRAVIDRARSPEIDDVQNHVAAWLGDIPAHDLFVRWEIDRINRGLAGETWEYDRFEEEWTSLRRLFFVPSYARILTLLEPVHDLESDRIGFWRVVLPRPGWFLPRVQGHEKHPEYSDLPLDLVPQIPFAYLALDRDDPATSGLRETLATQGYRVVGIEYRSLARPYKQDPRRAFNDTQVRLVLKRSHDSKAELPMEISLSAHVTLDHATLEPKIEAVTIEGPAGPGLRAASN